MIHRVLQPEGWPRPSGFSNGVVATGTHIFLSGQVGWDSSQRLVSDDFVDQARKALENIATLLAEAGARPEHMVRMTWYVTDATLYNSSARALGDAYRQVIGNHYPAMTMVQVVALAEPRALVEIEVTAVMDTAHR